MSVRDLLNMVWICTRRSVETSDQKLSDKLDRMASVYLAEARRLNPSLMATYAPSPTLH